MRIISKVTLTSLVFTSSLFGARNYQESNGLASVEAEDFASQALDSVRRWYVIHEGDAGPNVEDRDRNHASSASSKAYLEILPDTRTTHSDQLISGVNFSNTPGKMGILSYNVFSILPANIQSGFGRLAPEPRTMASTWGLMAPGPKAGNAFSFDRVSTNGPGPQPREFLKITAMQMALSKSPFRRPECTRSIARCGKMDSN